MVIFRSPVGEDDTLDDPRQRWGVFQAAPFFCGGLNELEDHPLGCCLRQRAFGTHGAVADDCEDALDRVAGSQVLSVLPREVGEGEPCFLVLGQAEDCLFVLGMVFFDEGIHG